MLILGLYIFLLFMNDFLVILIIIKEGSFHPTIHPIMSLKILNNHVILLDQSYFGLKFRSLAMKLF